VREEHLGERFTVSLNSKRDQTRKTWLTEAFEGPNPLDQRKELRNADRPKMFRNAKGVLLKVEKAGGVLLK